MRAGKMPALRNGRSIGIVDQVVTRVKRRGKSSQLTVGKKRFAQRDAEDAEKRGRKME
jgi:hypothetical protein